ncbi:hypothetical protein CMV16_25410 [Peribacillus simplex]|nr:hypothetical protein CMV16_25410 [Peribacillus simplex]
MNILWFLATNPITPITAILVVFPNQKESAELLIGLGSPLLFLVKILMDMGNTKRLICFQIQQQYLQMGRQSAIPFLLACLKRTLLK